MRKRHEDTILMASSGGPVYGGLGEEASAASHESDGEGLWRVVDDRLRGRWRLMFVLGAILAVIFAPIGYFLTQPLFESEGIIHVKPEMEVILRQIDETGELSLYPQFLATQASKIESENVLSSALKTDDQLRLLPWASEPNAVQRLKSGLTVDAPRNSQFVFATYASESAPEAQVCINAVLKAYMAQADDVGNLSIDEKLRKLERHHRDLSDKRFALRQDLMSLRSVQQFTTVNLDQVLNLKVADLEEVDQQLQWIKVRLAVSEDEGASTETDFGSTPTGAQLDLIDPELQTFRRDRDDKRRRFDEIAQTHGEFHRNYRMAKADLERAEADLAAQEAAALDQYAKWGSLVLSPQALDQNLSRSQVLLKEQELTAMRKRLADDIQIIGADIQKAEGFRTELTRLDEQIDQVSDRISALKLETTENVSRISVFQHGMRPIEPARDRRKALAGLGVLGGFGLSFAFFFILGSLDRRAYRLHQLGSQGSLRCLGVLPDLGRSLQDPEAAEMAAHCVHQIRNLVEATRPATEDGAVIAVSSPFQGDGKTSITLALGFSYAASGARTLVVDGDLVGRGLTRQLSLVGAHGFREVVRGGSVNGEIITLNRQPGTSPEASALDALPVGNDTSIGPQGIRRADMERMFDQLRRLYDIVLVDTGPVLGSLECIPIVSAADGVILSVRRGRQRNRLDECLRYLQSVGALCYGVVLNCAARSECHRYVSETSLAPTRAQLEAAAYTDEGRAPRENVLVSAMRAVDDEEQPWQ